MSLVVNPSISLLKQLYANFIYSGVHKKVFKFITTVNTNDYVFAADIDAWMISSLTKTNIGLTSSDIIDNLRVHVMLADGSVAYDSNSSWNKFTNLNKPRSDFLSTGKYLINENHGNRPYVMAATLSSSGEAFSTYFSNTTNSNRMYYCVRQGPSPMQNMGSIVISMNCPT